MPHKLISFEIRNPMKNFKQSKKEKKLTKITMSINQFYKEYQDLYVENPFFLKIKNIKPTQMNSLQ